MQYSCDDSILQTHHAGMHFCIIRTLWRMTTVRMPMRRWGDGWGGGGASLLAAP